MSSSASSDEVELVHCCIGKVYVFPVPKLDNTELGFKAATWQKTPIWTGRVRVVTKGKVTQVLLEHTDKDGLFAACPVTSDKTVEAASDSSRYFVLRLTDGQGRHALIGLGFNDRNEAFDFKVSVQDARKQKSDDWQLKQNNGPTKDYSLPEGTKIHVNIGTTKKSKKEGEGGGKKEGGGIQSLTDAVSSIKIDEGEKKKKKKKKSIIEPGASASSNVASNKETDLFGFGFGAAPASSGNKSNNNNNNNNNNSSSSSNSSSAFDAPADTPSDWVTF